MQELVHHLQEPLAVSGPLQGMHRVHQRLPRHRLRPGRVSPTLLPHPKLSASLLRRPQLLLELDNPVRSAQQARLVNLPVHLHLARLLHSVRPPLTHHPTHSLRLRIHLRQIHSVSHPPHLRSEAPTVIPSLPPAQVQTLTRSQIQPRHLAPHSPPESTTVLR